MEANKDDGIPESAKESIRRHQEYRRQIFMQIPAMRYDRVSFILCLNLCLWIWLLGCVESSVQLPLNMFNQFEVVTYLLTDSLIRHPLCRISVSVDKMINKDGNNNYEL